MGDTGYNLAFSLVYFSLRSLLKATWFFLMGGRDSGVFQAGLMFLSFVTPQQMEGRCWGFEGIPPSHSCRVECGE